jgi:MFS family permease
VTNPRNSPEPPSRPHSTATFWVAACSLLLVFAASGAPIPLFNVYRAEAGVDNADIGWVAVGYFFSAAAALLLLGRLSDHLGRRPLALAALGCAALSCVVLARVEGAASLLAGRMLQGLACGVASSALGAYAVDSAPARLRWLSALISSSAPMTGLAVGALVGGVLMEAAPWPRQLVYVLLGSLLVLCAVLVLLSRETMRHRPGALRSVVPGLHVPAGAGRLLLSTSAAIVGTWSLGSYYQTFGPAMLVEHLGVRSPTLVAAAFASVMVLNPVGGPVFRHWSPVHAMRAGMTLFMLAVLAIVVTVHAGAVLPFLVASLMLGLSQGVAVTGGMRALLERTQAGNRAGLLALIYLVSYCAAAIPSMVGSVLVRWVEPFTLTLGYAALSLASATVALWAARGRLARA